MYNRKQVDLTDVEGPVLRNLRDCVHLNAAKSRDDLEGRFPANGNEGGAGGGSSGVPQNNQGGAAVKAAAPQLPSDSDLFDDADSVDEGTGLEALLLESDATEEQGGEGGQGGGRRACLQGGEEGLATKVCNKGGEENQAEASWHVGNMQVRMLDWLESLQLMDGQQQPQQPQQPQQQQQQGERVEEHTPIDPKQFYAHDLLRMGEGSPQGVCRCMCVCTRGL